MQDNLIIGLKKPINIAHNGGLREVEVLEVSLPNIKDFNLYAGIKTIITKSVLEMEKLQNNTKIDNNNNNNIDTEVDDDDKLPLELFLATNTLNDLSEKVNQYLIKFAKFDNEISVNKNNIQKLSIKDYNNILERVSYFLFQI